MVNKLRNGSVARRLQSSRTAPYASLSSCLRRAIVTASVRELAPSLDIMANRCFLTPAIDILNLSAMALSVLPAAMPARISSCRCVSSGWHSSSLMYLEETISNIFYNISLLGII